MKPLAILFALLLTGCSAVTAPSQPTDVMKLIFQVEENAPYPVDGEFVLDIKATGKRRRTLYLNTEQDYRDRRNVNVVLGPAVLDGLDALGNEDVAAYFLHSRIRVKGTAKRVKTWLYAEGKRTKSYYYQTSVYVDDVDNIEKLEDFSEQQIASMETLQAQDYRDYLLRKGKKAYALASDNDTTWASGFGYGYRTQEKADKRALRECEINRENYAVSSPCVIVSRNDFESDKGE